MGDPDGEVGDLSRCVLMTLPWGMTDRVPAILDLAREFGLVGFEPQGETVIG